MVLKWLLIVVAVQERISCAPFVRKMIISFLLCSLKIFYYGSKSRLELWRTKGAAMYDYTGQHM